MMRERGREGDKEKSERLQVNACIFIEILWSNVWFYIYYWFNNIYHRHVYILIAPV